MANAAEHSGANGHAGVISAGGHAGAPAAAAAVSAAAGADARLAAVRLLLWALAGVLALRQAAAVLRAPSGPWPLGSPHAPYDPGALYIPHVLHDPDRFTGTPFAGLVLKPFLGLAPPPSLGVLWTCASLLAVAAVGLVAARGLPDPVPRRTALLASPVLVGLMMASLPVREAAASGRGAVLVLPALPVLLVLLALFRVPSDRPAGFLVGLAAALQPALLLFAPLLWRTGRRPAAGAAAATFAAATALSWAALPRDSWAYWAHHLAGTGLGGAPDAPANQSVHGALLR
ncbi:glycosyltransferase 87 family protein, partial [Streptomyces toxytricini]|uniref:glycosyltransferase 87 family protein n=1 Tax=Streptomyces toxytricini TaxID=67369 RepID=UPI003416B09D